MFTNSECTNHWYILRNFIIFFKGLQSVFFEKKLIVQCHFLGYFDFNRKFLSYRKSKTKERLEMERRTIKQTNRKETKRKDTAQTEQQREGKERTDKNRTLTKTKQKKSNKYDYSLFWTSLLQNHFLWSKCKISKFQD